MEWEQTELAQCMSLHAKTKVSQEISKDQHLQGFGLMCHSHAKKTVEVDFSAKGQTDAIWLMQRQGHIQPQGMHRGVRCKSCFCLIATVMSHHSTHHSIKLDYNIHHWSHAWDSST